MCMVQGVGCFLVSLFFAGNPYGNLQHLIPELYLCLDQDGDSTHGRMAEEVRSECTALILLNLKEVINNKVAILIIYETETEFM